MQIVMETISLGREMFCEQLRCNIMIDGNAFQANIDGQRVEGSNVLGSSYLNLYSI